jgi:MATE family multidrug resistance protein
MTLVFFQMVQLINIYFMGHMTDPNLLAGVGLGNMLINVCVFAVAYGLNGTIETFVGWSFGSEKYYECGYHLNRAKVIITVILLPVMVMFLFVDSILVSLAQDPEVSRIARNYVVWTMPGVFCLVQFDCTKRLLQTIK